MVVKIQNSWSSIYGCAIYQHQHWYWLICSLVIVTQCRIVGDFIWSRKHFHSVEGVGEYTVYNIGQNWLLAITTVLISDIKMGPNCHICVSLIQFALLGSYFLWLWTSLLIRFDLDWDSKIGLHDFLLLEIIYWNGISINFQNIESYF